jgi:ribosome-interacting GTPase 1
VKEIAPEFKIRNGEIVIKEDISLDQLIDSFMRTCCYLPYLLIINKADLLKGPEIQDKSSIYISAKNGLGLDILREKMWGKLDLMRLYLKPLNGEPDFNHPLIIKNNQNLIKILARLNFEDKELIKKAKIYGPGAKFPGQEVSLTFIPQDETAVYFLS